MPRQPLSYVRRDAETLFLTNALERRPELAVLIAQCIATWSEVEAQMALLLSAIMKAHERPAAAVFLSIRNARAQREAMVAAAESELDGRELEMFRAIMIVYQALEAQRSDLAHGIFAISDDLPDSIVWMHAKDYVFGALETITGLLRERPPVVRGARKEAEFVYRKGDLESLRNQIMELAGAIFSLTIFLHVPRNMSVEAAETEFQRLYTSPQIQQALSRLRGG